MNNKKLEGFIDKFIELNLLKPFIKGNLISGLIWLDLMIRKYLIEQLQYYVYRIDYKGSYTISLNGKWGTGKSSIIEKLLNENKDSRIKFIQFDPWKYDDESSMIKGLIARIVNELEIKIVSLELNINRLIDKYINDKQISIFLELLFSNKQLKNEDKIIDLINERIVKDNLKLVVIIDNLDRAENENIILIYKLISCILNFKNTLYILVYDKEIIKKVFKDKGYDFLDKIVKKSIEIPEFENQRLRIISYKALEKIATFHNVCINEIEELEIVKNEDYFETFRDIIIFINNNLMFYICENTNFSDFVLIKIIKKNNYQLYMEIEKNKHHILDNKLQNNHLKNILNEIAKSNELGIMKLLFPSLFNETKENNTNQNKRICSPFYFDYYFYGNIEEGDYSIIKKKFIDKMGQNRINNKGILPFIKEYKGNMVSNLVREIISNLSGSDIEYKNQIIKNIISYMEFYVGGNLYDNRIIVQSIAKDLIQIFDSSNFKKIKKIFYRPMNIYITYIFKTELKGFENSKNNIFEKIYTQTINNIIKNKISIYSQKYYRKSNIFAFYKNESIVEEYLKGVLNESNIFIFLEDFIGCFFENGYYKYFINIELLNDYISQKYIYLLIEKSIPLNEDNKFIKNLFLQTYKNRSDELVTIDLLDKRIERFKLSRKDTEK